MARSMVRIYLTYKQDFGWRLKFSRAGAPDDPTGPGRRRRPIGGLMTRQRAAETIGGAARLTSRGARRACPGRAEPELRPCPGAAGPASRTGEAASGAV